MGFLFSPRRKAEAQDRMAGDHALGQAAARKLGAVRHGAGGVRFRHQRAGHGGGAARSRRRAAAGRTTTRSPCRRCCAAKSGCFRRRAAPNSTGSAPRAATAPQFAGVVQQLFDHLLPQAQGEDGRPRPQPRRPAARVRLRPRAARAASRRTCAAGRIGLAQNRLPASSRIDDPPADALFDARGELPRRYRELGREALAEGAVAVVSLAGGIGSRWTKGAGVVKALNPFCRLGGQAPQLYRSPPGEEPARRAGGAGRCCRTSSPPAISRTKRSRAVCATWGTTDTPARCCSRPAAPSGCGWCRWSATCGSPGRRRRSSCSTSRRRRCAKGLHATLIAWARQTGRRQRLHATTCPMQCLHPVGHWYELPNLLRNGVLAQLAGGAAAASPPAGAQHRHRGRGRGRGAAGLSHRAGRGHDGRGDRASRGRSRRRAGAWWTGVCGSSKGWRCPTKRSSRASPATTPRPTGSISTGC